MTSTTSVDVRTISDDEYLRDVLIRAKQLISSPEHWTRLVAARDSRGEPTTYADDEACQFCSFGAIMRVSMNENRIVTTTSKVRKYAFASAAASWELCKTYQLATGEFEYIGPINDGMTHQQVMQLFDDTIERLKV